MDWLKLDKVTIFEGRDENGNRYLSRFLSDFKKEFNPDTINAGCQRCLEDYYLKFTKHLSKMGNKKSQSDFILKAKYNGIPLEFGSQTFVNNSNIDAEKALKLLKGHKKGKELFEKLPKNIDDLLENGQGEDPAKVLEKKGRDELDGIATGLGLDPKEYSNKGLIAQAILAKQSEASGKGLENGQGEDQ